VRTGQYGVSGDIRGSDQLFGIFIEDVTRLNLFEFVQIRPSVSFLVR